jgi:hypothetical protein
MGSFKPRLDVLPGSQRSVWPQFASVPREFVLYGGTAVALRLGHRVSLDFDFFSSGPLNADALYATVPLLKDSTFVQREPDALTVVVDRGDPVKVSFFGGITIGCIDPPEITDDGVLRVASLRDLLGTKLKVLLQRVEAKDYLDIAALLRSGVSLGEGLGAAKALYEPQFPPSEALKTLVYFEGGDLETLDNEVKAYLIQTVQAFKGPVPTLTKTSAQSLTADRIE